MEFKEWFESDDGEGQANPLPEVGEEPSLEEVKHEDPNLIRIAELEKLLPPHLRGGNEKRAEKFIN